MLTRKQHQCLVYLCKRAEETPVSPSYEEIKEALGLKSKAGVDRLLRALRERGFITYIPRRARSIVILRNAEGQSYAGLEAENLRLRTELAQAKEQIARLHRRRVYRPQEARA